MLAESNGSGGSSAGLWFVWTPKERVNVGGGGAVDVGGLPYSMHVVYLGSYRSWDFGRLS